MHTTNADGHVHALEALSAEVVCTVRRAGYYELDGSWVLPRRVTPYHVLFFITRGRVEFTVAGSRYALEDGNVILTPPQMVQSGNAAATGHVGLFLYVVHFSAQLHGLLDAPLLLGLPATFSLGAQRRREMFEVCRRMVSELERGRPGSWLAANGDCARVVALLWREAIERGESTKPRGEVTLSALVRLRPVFDAIQARYSEPLRIVDLATLVHLHPVYFSTLFRRGTGLSPGQYISHYRLGKARELLGSTDLPLSDIARRTGHGTSSYLSRAFHRAEGIPPGKYRRMVQGASGTARPAI